MNKKILEKIFLSQFGATKPPWIDKDVFYKLPFNFCDRFCERCQFQKICRVFLEEKSVKKNGRKWVLILIATKQFLYLYMRQ